MVTKRVLPAARRVRELITVAAALLKNLRIVGQPVPSAEFFEAFSHVRQMMDELAKEGLTAKPTIELLSSWQRRYLRSNDVRATMRADVDKFLQDAASICISLEDDNLQTAMSVAKYFAWRISLFVEAVNGIWPEEPENITRLNELTRISNELFQIVSEGSTS